MKQLWLLIIFSAMTALGGCTGAAQIDQNLREVIVQHGLTGDPSQGRDLPGIDEPLAQLGMKLFFTRALGGKQDSACVSCHHPALGGGDAIPLSIGTGADTPTLLGPGRTHPAGPLVPRNAPTTFNIAMYDRFLFHDGRVESLGKTPGRSGNDGYGIRTPNSMMLGYPDHLAGLTLAETQARFPVTSEEEMRGFDFGTDRGVNANTRDQRSRELLASIVGDYGEGAGRLPHNNWLAEFQSAFNSQASAETLITFENIVKAIGAYENSQVFINTPWKAYVQGDNTALTEAAKRGALLFFKPAAEGGADCVSCHSGDFLTDEAFYVLAVPQIGVGRDSGIAGDDDFGRYLETGRKADKYAFRTPTLLNVEVTGPYGHDGAYASLEEMVRHHLNPAKAVENYNYVRLDPAIPTRNAEKYTRQALEQLQNNRVAGIKTVSDIELTEAQLNDLLEFLYALTDPCVTSRECLAPWIPDSTTSDPDGLRLMAVGADGQPL